MITKSRTKRDCSLMLQASCLALLSQSAVAPAFAQARDPDADIVVVTGTRVKNPNLEQASQIQVVGADEILFQNADAAEELIRQLPGVAPGVGPNVNNGQNGAATLNLRNLGTNRNIVLLDSQRIVPFGLAGETDTNLIPVSLIERVELVTGGASSVYGADAIAGVTNFITRRDFSGVELQTSYRLTEESDGDVFRAELTFGGDFADGRGNAAFSLGYRDQNQVLQGDRQIGLVSLSSNTGLPQGSATAAPGSLFAPGAIAGGIDPATGAINVGVNNDFNFSPLNLFQTPQERHNIYAQANYEITDNIEAYGSGFFVRSFVEANLAPSGSFTNNWQLPLSNPFLPTAFRNQLCGALAIAQPTCDAAAAATTLTDPNYREVTIQFGRRFVEAGPRVQAFTTDSFQFTTGLRGDLSETWSWDVSGTYGESTQVQVRTGWGLASRLQQSLRSFNTTNCAVTTGGCVPINLFGAAGTLGQGAVDFVTQAATSQTLNTTLANVIGSVNGDLGAFKSPWAENPIGVAFGAEYREYGATRTADVATSTPNEVLGAGAPAPDINGRYDSYEAFGEVIAPVLEDLPFIKSFQIEAGIRYSDYSTTGGSITWKAGGNWIINDDYRIRGVYQRAVRSPNIGELFAPQVVGLNNLTTDPCQQNLPVGNAALTALCVATGVPAGLIGTVIPPIAGQVNQTTGGNPLLDVETATTFTAGIVATPSFLPDVTFSFDYFNIHIADAVSQPAVGDVVNGCYATALNPSLTFNAFCALIGRNPGTGSLNGPQSDTPGIIRASSNLGTYNTSGFDWSFAYDLDLGEMGSLAFNHQGTHTLENRFKANPTSIDRDCVGFYGVNCDPGLPKWQFNQRLTWSYDRFDLSLRHRFIGGLAVDPTQPGVAALFPAFTSIDRANYFDMTARVEVREGIDLTATVDNLFDKSPPVVGNTIGSTAFNSGNTFPTIYDALGRTYTASLRAKF